MGDHFVLELPQGGLLKNVHLSRIDGQHECDSLERIGHEAPDGGAGLEFWGQSFVADPSGVILQRAGVDKEQNLLVEVDLDVVDTQRTHWPFLRDRRIDAYAEITKRYLD